MKNALQVIISPAKQMRVEADAFAPRGIPPFPEKTEQLVQALHRIEREEGPSGLKSLWSVNDKLLSENIERLHNFASVLDGCDLENATIARLVGPAVFSYVGIQYRSMAPDVLDLDALDWLQGHLWVLSALYGCVRPFDAVQPYRLEMAAKLSVESARDLYAFWGADIARAVCGVDERGDAPCEAPASAAPSTTVINLASVEYAKAVLPHLPAHATSVTCIFGEDLRNGRPVQRATASKIARGSMVRWMAEHSVENPNALTQFDIGYAFAPELSHADDARSKTLVFMKR